MNSIKQLPLFVFLALFSINTLSQTLEIHTINVGHGDAGLIVVRDTAKLKMLFTNASKAIPANRAHMLKEALDNNFSLVGTVKKSVLIDFGDNSRSADKIASYLTKVGVGYKVNYGILSHNHKDHYGGFSDLVINQFVSFDTIYYRGNDKPKASSSFTKTFLNKIPAGTLLSVVDVNTADLVLKSTTNAHKNINLTCVFSDGYVFTKNASSNRIGKSSQNDFSCGWVIQYGGYRYFTAGDISGYNTSSYKDVETTLTDSLISRDASVFTQQNGTVLPKGHICCFKSSHHGSKNSSNNYFLSKIHPQTCFITCGKKHRHPNTETIDRYNATASIANTFLTNLSAKYSDATRSNIGKLNNQNYICGDIVCVVNDFNITTDVSYTVFWNGKLDMSVMGSKDKPSDMRTPEANGVSGPGVKDFNCHKVNTMSYLTNH